jgi:hypothetical protein
MPTDDTMGLRSGPGRRSGEARRSRSSLCDRHLAPLRRTVCAIGVGLALLVPGCSAGDDQTEAGPRIGAEIVQLRRDEVLHRVEIAVTNRSGGAVTINTIELRVRGFSGGGRQPKDEPLPAGQRVNLPTPYGEVSCDADFHPHVGTPRVTVEVTAAGEGSPRRVGVRPTDPRHILEQVAEHTCLTRRLESEVALSYGPTWRREGHGADTVVHGTLEARLLIDQPRQVTQLRGTVLYRLVPEQPSQGPLARLTPEHPAASIPVRVELYECTGHAKGETKKPFEFLVWLAAPGGQEHAISPRVTERDIGAFREVCAF